MEYKERDQDLSVKNKEKEHDFYNNDKVIKLKPSHVALCSVYVCAKNQ